MSENSTTQASDDGDVFGLITREQLRKKLGDCTDRTILRFEKEGLPVHPRGGLRLYDPEEVAAWLRGEHRPKKRRVA